MAVAQLLPLPLAGSRRAVGVLLTVTGGVVAAAAVLRWRRVQAALRRAQELPPTRIPLLLGLGLAALTTFVVVLLLLSRTAG